MVNNAIPDSIITKMTCRSFLPPVKPKVRSTDVVLTPENTLKILNMIKPVTKVFTAMDTAKLVIVIVIPQELSNVASWTNVAGLSVDSQVAGDYKLKSAAY